MRFSQMKGLDPKLSQLMKSMRRGNAMHALLFDGPEGTGKRTMADILTRAALCKCEDEYSCDVCPTCKKCLDGVHPDVHIIDIEEDRTQIRIDQIRSLLEKLSLASYEGGKKIVIIEHADAMNMAAQNALLKTLEEPVGDTLFFLLSVSPSALLPTIRSRCLQVHFNALETEKCFSVLVERGVEKAKAELCSALAAGCVGRALELSEDERYFQLRDRVIGAVESIKKPEDVPSAITQIGKIKDNGMGMDILSILELWAWDLMRIQNDATIFQNDSTDRLKKSVINGNQLLRLITEARVNRNVNVSWTNIIEPLLYAIAEGVHSDR